MISDATTVRLFADWELRQQQSEVQQRWGIQAFIDSGASINTTDKIVSCVVYGQRFFVCVESVWDFLRRIRIYPSDLNEMQIRILVEGIANLILQPTTTLASVSDTVKRGLSPEETHESAPASLLGPGFGAIPSLRDLIGHFKSRRWNSKMKLTIPAIGTFEEAGFMPPGDTDEAQQESHRRDCDLLLRIMQQHNAVFRRDAELVGVYDEGVVKAVRLRNGDRIVNRADLHCNLRSFMALLDSLRDPEFDSGHGPVLDDRYHCMLKRSVILCGDYGDRYGNHIELLMALLLFRMEGGSVYLIRGNHENVEINRVYSADGRWFAEHARECEECYSSLPIAVCVCGEGSKEYGHYSHATFSPAVDLAPLLEGGQEYMIVPKRPRFSERVHALAQTGSEKVRRAVQTLLSIDEKALSSKWYMWGTVADEEAMEKYGRYYFSPEIINAYRKIASGPETKLCFFVRGHDHYFMECMKTYEMASARPHQDRVVLTSMPVADDSDKEESNTQVLLFEVASRAKDWTKQLAAYRLGSRGPFFRLINRPIRMYESFLPD